MPTLDAQRHRVQRAFLASGLPLTIGAVADCPLSALQLAALSLDSPHVIQRIESGLTATVFQLRIGGRDYALKRARPQCLVQNPDGELSFLNELQRRAEIAELAARIGPIGAIVPTLYGSLAEQMIVTPWIAGRTVDTWDERRLVQFFDNGRQLIECGFFEWDFCPGNLIDDGRTIWLFDFGYMYRFDPLRQFNTASRGDNVPLFHLAERFETRNYFAWLLTREQEVGQKAATAAFRLEKEVALDCYERMRSNLASRGAAWNVLTWLDSIMASWRTAIASDLDALYLKEGWRSHAMDLDDDLRGRTCTPRTLARCDWLLTMLTDHFDALVALDAFLHDDIGHDRNTLIQRYRQFREQAVNYQVQAAPRAPL